MMWVWATLVSWIFLALAAAWALVRIAGLHNKEQEKYEDNYGKTTGGPVPPYLFAVRDNSDSDGITGTDTKSA